MHDADERLVLKPARWYGWQMIPGYSGRYNVPYFSPVYLTKVSPRGSGQRILGLSFFNAFYAVGVQNFSVDIRILKHAPGYLVGDLGGNEDRCAVVSEIEFAWIERFCPDLWLRYPPTSFGPVAEGSANAYLHLVFGTDELTEPS